MEGNNQIRPSTHIDLTGYNFGPLTEEEKRLGSLRAQERWDDAIRAHPLTSIIGFALTKFIVGRRP